MRVEIGVGKGMMPRASTVAAMVCESQNNEKNDGASQSSRLGWDGCSFCSSAIVTHYKSPA